MTHILRICEAFGQCEVVHAHSSLAVVVMMVLRMTPRAMVMLMMMVPMVLYVPIASYTTRCNPA